jgi:Co/Zn/Cd efflux system component
LDINTTNISKEQLDSSIKVDARILEYHDLHINEPSSKHKSISFHIVFNDENIILKECEKIIMRIKQNLKHYGFSHIIIQNDTYKNIKNQIHCDIYQ